MRPVDHHIQRQILRDLSKVDFMRFRDLKPSDLDNNVFTYHLKSLVAVGLIQKKTNGYTLSSSGMTYLDYAAAKRLVPRLQPKLITILVVQTDDKVALLERKTQPYLGKFMLPSGKMHFGEKFEEHAKREAKEKLGLDVDLKMRGMVNILISKEGIPITHVVASVCALQLTSTPKIHCLMEERFSAAWAKKSDLGSMDLLSVTKEVVDLVNGQTGYFTKDFTVELDA